MDAPCLAVQPNQTIIYKSRPLIFQWVAEIDIASRRIRLFRIFLWRWTRTVIDCSLEDCIALGIVEYHVDGYAQYGTYFKLKNGDWYAIPTKGVSFNEASNVVRIVSAATGIPRLDIKYS